MNEAAAAATAAGSNRIENDKSGKSKKSSFFDASCVMEYLTQAIYLCIYVCSYLSIYLPIYLSIYLSIYLFIYWGTFFSTKLTGKIIHTFFRFSVNDKEKSGRPISFLYRAKLRNFQEK